MWLAIQLTGAYNENAFAEPNGHAVFGNPDVNAGFGDSAPPVSDARRPSRSRFALVPTRNYPEEGK